jgi:signal transduction histidine kinase
VQNRFVLSLARLKSGDATLDDEIQEISNTIDQLRKTIFDHHDVKTEQIVSGFEQFLNVEISAPTESLSRLQTRVVEEAIANAYRHGKATHVKVLLDEGSTLLIVDDDGFGPKEGPKGLGSFIFDSIGPWSIEALPSGGSRFQLRFDS